MKELSSTDLLLIAIFVSGCLALSFMLGFLLPVSA